MGQGLKCSMGLIVVSINKARDILIYTGVPNQDLGKFCADKQETGLFAPYVFIKPHVFKHKSQLQSLI